jgi:chitinase
MAYAPSTAMPVFGDDDDGDAGARTILISISSDNLTEGDETFSVALSEANGALLGAPSMSVVTIVDVLAQPVTPGSLQFTQSSVQVGENVGSITLTVTRTGGSDGAASVLYSTSGSSAVAGSDYASASGTLQWADGDASPKTFHITILNDPAAELAESFHVRLNGVTGATLGQPANVTITINDDEEPATKPSISISGTTVDEDAGSAIFTVTLSKAATEKVRVHFATAAGPATESNDYVGTSGTLIFEVGDTSETIAVTLVDDGAIELTESFNVILSDAIGATIAESSATATINDDDGVEPLRFAVAGSVRGANGSNYKTSLQILNPSDEAIGGQIVFGQAGAGGGGSTSSLPYQLAPGELRSFGDLLAAIRPDLTGLGALDVVPAGGKTPLSLMRVYNDGEEKGTWGMTVEASNGRELAAGQRGIVIVPSDLQQYRLNVGVRTFDAPATLRVTTRNAAGEVVHATERSYGAQSVSQSGAAAFADAPVEHDAVLEVEVLGGKAVVYGTATDNITQDTAIAFAAPLAAAEVNARVSRTIPVVASTAGSHGSYFRTSLQLHNPYAFRQSVTLRYGTQQLALTLQPRETRSVADLVAALGSAGIGSVDVESVGGAPVAAIRVFNDGGSLGTSGLAEPLAGESQMLRKGDRAALLPPSDLEKFRFNVGVRAFGDGATMRVTCGTSDPVERIYAANEFGQISASDFCGAALTATRVRIEMTAGSAIVYGATTDNATQDPNMQFAQKY